MILPKERAGLHSNPHRVIVRGLLDGGASSLGYWPQLC
jgi:hypothetical protein